MENTERGTEDCCPIRGNLFFTAEKIQEEYTQRDAEDCCAMKGKFLPQRNTGGIHAEGHSGLLRNDGSEGKFFYQ